MDFSAHTTTTHEVWTVIDGKPAYRYRANVPSLAASLWAADWNDNHPADVPAGYTFVAVRATTTFQAA